jgi:drug/metabolite transporter (DMT)-like permease
MHLGELHENARSLGSQAQADHAAVVLVLQALDQARGLRPVHQADGAVMAQEEVAGRVADGRPARVLVAADGQQELVLRGCQPGGFGLLGAPMKEPPEARPEQEQSVVFGILDVADVSWHGRKFSPGSPWYDPHAFMAIPLSALLLVVGSSLAWSAHDVTRKFLVGRVRPVPLAFLLTVAAAPLFAIWTMVDGMPDIKDGYALPAVSSVLLNIAANLMFFVALRTSALSVTIPLLSLTPVFTALLGIPMLGEVPTPLQGLGIVLVVAGAFALNLPEERPYWRWERGAALMTAVAFLWSLTVPLDKMAMAQASAPFHATVLCGGVAAGVLAVLVWQRRLGELAGLRHVRGVFALALVTSILALGLQLLAMQQVWVGLVETLKRGIGNVAAVGLGRAVFGEPVTLRKLLAVGLMAVGVGLILI